MSKGIKKIKKAVKRTVKSATGVLGAGDVKTPAVPEPVTPAAAEVTVAKDTAEEDNKDTESSKKKARSRGKRGLSVSRSSGSGLNI